MFEDGTASAEKGAEVPMSSFLQQFIQSQQQQSLAPQCAPVPEVGMDNSMVNDMLRADQNRRRNTDPSLVPIEGALNDTMLGEVERNALVGNYMSEQRGELPWSLPIDAMSGEFPLSSDDGLASHLLEELKTDTALRSVVMALSTTVNDSDEVDIAAAFQAARSASALVDGADLNPDSDLRALRAMALFANAKKIGQPADLDLEDPTMVVYRNLFDAHMRSRKSESPTAAVMSRGAPANHRVGSDEESVARPAHALDHNFHFLSHAYLAAQMKQEFGYGDEQAGATSGYAGARYEWGGAGLAQNEGNAALKDVLMNAEGAQFGIDLMNNSDRQLPGMCEGPTLEDRASFGPGDPDLYRTTWASIDNATGYGASGQESP